MTPDGLAVSNLALKEIIQKDGEYILYGFFNCENPDCNTKYPIIEGVPCIINPDEKFLWLEIASTLELFNPPNEIRQYVLNHLNDVTIHSKTQTTGTGSLSYEEESLMGCFMDNNYGEFESNYKPSYKWVDYRLYWKSVINTSKPEIHKKYSMTLELGCSVGRYIFEMARMSDLAVGLDLRFRAVLEAARIQRQGSVKFHRRVRGLKFQEVSTDFEPTKNTLFLVGNALDPPFISESFDLVASLNLLDNIKLPRILLGQMNALLRPGGILLLGSPFEWRPDICEPTEWLETEQLDGPVTVRNILEGKVLSEYGLNYTVETQEDIIWPLRNHDRYWSMFRSNLIRAKKN
jgi:SAM-dependent methyltransferase